jgi:hypothetical protein
VVQTRDLIGLTLIFSLNKKQCCYYSITKTMLMIGVLNLLRNVKFGIGVRQHNQKKFDNSFCTELCRMQKDTRRRQARKCARQSLLGTGKGRI